MEVLNNIWNFFNTPNEEVISIILNFATFIEITLFMLIFTTFLSIKSTAQQKFSYVICLGILTILGQLLIPNPIAILIINLSLSLILIKVIFKTTIPTAIFSQILPYLVMSLVSFIFSNLYYMATTHNFNDYINIPIQRIIYLTFVYLTLFFIYLWLKKSNLNLKFINTMDKKNKHNLIITSLLGLLIITLQSYVTSYYSTNLSLIIGFLSFISLITYFGMSVYSLTNMTKLEETTQELESAEAFNKSLSALHDNVRGFKHDFDNIISTIGRFHKNGRYGRIKRIL